MKNIKTFESYSQSEIDRILDKITSSGIDSLTPGEKQYLADPEKTDVKVAREKPQPPRSNTQHGSFHLSEPIYFPDTPSPPIPKGISDMQSDRKKKLNSGVKGKKCILLHNRNDVESDRNNLLEKFYPSLEFQLRNQFVLKVNVGKDIKFYYYSSKEFPITIVYNENEISEWDVCIVEDDLSIYEKTLTNLISVGKHIIGLDDYYYFDYSPFKKEVTFSSSDGGWIKLKKGKFDHFVDYIKGKDTWDIVDEIDDDYDKYKELCYRTHDDNGGDDIEKDFLSSGLVEKTEIEGEFSKSLDEPPYHIEAYPIDRVKDKDLTYLLIPMEEYFINLGENICL